MKKLFLQNIFILLCIISFSKFLTAQESEIFLGQKTEQKNIDGEMLLSPNYQQENGKILYSIDLLKERWAKGVVIVNSTIYITSSDGNKHNYWDKYTLDGTFIDSTKQTTTSSWGYADLAFDGTYILASDSKNIDKIDPNTLQVVSSIKNTSNSKHYGIAYDPNEEAIYSRYTILSRCVKIDAKTGTTIKKLSPPHHLGTYGIAFDNFSNSNYGSLWYAEPTINSSYKTSYGVFRISRADTSSGHINFSFDLSSLLPDSSMVGGLEIIRNHPDYPNKIIAIAVERKYKKLLFVDITDAPEILPNKLEEVHSFGGYDEANIMTTGMVQYSDYLYAINNGDLWIYNIAGNPEKPTYLKTVTIGGGNRVYLENDLLFVSHGEPTKKSFSIFRLTNPENPNRISTVDTGNPIFEMACNGNYLFVTHVGISEFVIYDISNPTTPVKHSQQALRKPGTNITINKNRNLLFISYYQANSYSGIEVFDISNMNTITQSTYTETYGTEIIRPTLIDDQYLVCIRNEKGKYPSSRLICYDYSDKTELKYQTLQTISHDTLSWNIAKLDEIFFVTTPGEGIQTFSWDSEIKRFMIGASLSQPEPLDIVSFVPSSSASSTIANSNIQSVNYNIATLNSNAYLYETNGYGYDNNSVGSLPNKVIKVYKPGTVGNTKVTLQTNVSPAEASADGCSVSPSGGEYNSGTGVSINATAATGWGFYEWSGDLSGSANPAQLTMDSDKNVTGNFLPILKLTLDSAPQEINFPPNALMEKRHIATANLAADGVDWELSEITFNATEKVKAKYIEAILYLNDLPVSWGEITTDADTCIQSIKFTLSKTIKEGETLPLKFYYKFTFPNRSKEFSNDVHNRESAPYITGGLQEIKKFAISTSINKIKCIPIPVSARPGIKLPAGAVLVSETQNMASVWNASLTPAMPFLSLQNAINYSGTIDGHEIRLASGFYEQSEINITKGVKIQGQGYVFFLDKNKSEDKNCFILAADNIKINLCTFYGFKFGIYASALQKIKNCELKTNTFRKSFRGIGLFNCDSANIEHNYLHDGITIHGNGNTIEDNYIGYKYPDENNKQIHKIINIGLSLTGNNNTIKNNDIDGCEDGFIFENSANNIVVNNNFNGAKEPNKFNNIINTAITFKFSEKNQIYSNSIKGFSENGIVLKWSSDNEIKDNIIASNYSPILPPPIFVRGNKGIILSDANNNLITNNWIYDIKTGIYIKNSEKNKLTENRFIYKEWRKNNIFTDIELAEGSKHNLISKNKNMKAKTAIVLKGENTFSNEIKENLIGVDETGNNGIQITNGGYYGIRLCGKTHDNLITGNIISAESGIYSNDIIGTYNNVINNKIGVNSSGTAILTNSNIVCGIELDGLNNKILNNIIGGYSEEGILLYGDNHIVQNNKICTDINKQEYIPEGKGISFSGENNKILYNSIGNNSIGIMSSGHKALIKGNIIGANILGNKSFPNQDGIVFDFFTGDNIIEENVIVNNKRYGIYLDSKKDSLINYIRSGGEIINDQVMETIIIKNNCIRNNAIGTDLSGTKKWGNKVGVFLKDSKNNSIVNNKIWYNQSGIIEVNSKNTISGNNIAHNTGNTGIHLSNSQSIISGNSIYNDETDAIKTERGSQPTIIKNNIFDNKGFALVNTDEHNQITADNNWWGNSSDPKDKIKGNVSVNKWLSKKSEFLIKSANDTLFITSGIRDTQLVFCQNLAKTDDKIEITITGEKPEWIENKIFVYSLSDTNSSMSVVPIKIPSSVTSGTIAKFYITGKSQNNPSVVDVDSFYVSCYNSTASLLTVYPKRKTISLGDSIHFSVNCIDKFSKPIEDTLVNLSWESSGGTITSSGLFIADSTEKEVKIKITETGTGIFTYAYLNIASDSMFISKISITPDSITIAPNSTFKFSAKAFNKNANEINFIPNWKTSGGKIDSTGLFTATATVGEYYVTVFDNYNNTQASAKVIVSLNVQTDETNMLPQTYSLQQNYPNPFNPTTTIAYELPFESKVKVEIFNILGQRVKTLINNTQHAGKYSMLWDAGNFASGVYIIKMNATSSKNDKHFTKTIKTLLLK